MILAITFSPSIDLFYHVPTLPVAGQVARAGTRYDDAGGKGINASRMIRRLEGYCMNLLPIGGWTGARLEQHLNDEGLVVEFVDVRGYTRINTHIFSAEGTELKVNEPAQAMAPKERARLGERVRHFLPECRAVLACGSIAGENVELAQSIVTTASDKGVPVWVDTSGDALKAIRGLPISCIKVNRDEFIAAAGSMEAIKEWLDAGAKSICVTDGSNPVLLARRDAAWLEATPFKTSTAPRGQSLGAGDAFLGGMAWASSEGRTDEDALKIACACGAMKAAGVEWARMRRDQVEKLAKKVEIRVR